MKIYDSELSRYFDVFMAVLLLDQKRESLLPDICDVFGKELTLKFIDLFGGSTITVPSRERIEKLTREVAIYSAVNGGQTAAKVASLYEISLDSVTAIHSRIQAQLDSVGLRVE